MRRAILMGFVWALGAGAATAQHTDDASIGCGASARQASKRPSFGLAVVGLTGGTEQRLVCFSEFRPGLTRTIGVVTGLSVDTRLEGIDYRPATGQLYGLGDAGGVYTVDTSSAEATLQSRLNVALDGFVFGVDFNPVVDRLRVVSDSGQNLRVNVTTGATTVDAALNTPPTPGPTRGVTAVAYTNNDDDAASGTTLFAVNIAETSLFIQAPPNSGSLNFAGTLRQDVGSQAGFDIFSRVSSLGITEDNSGYASLFVAGRARFYSVNLFTGEATLRGTFPFHQFVVDIAIPTRQ
jgi:hypothetical protein